MNNKNDRNDSDSDNNVKKAIILLLKIDAKNLFERIVEREKEAILEFSLKRTREHFADLLFTRYHQAEIKELKHLSSELIIALNQFYNKVDELKWYLNHTQDMTTTVEDRYIATLRLLNRYYKMLELYLNAELGVQEEKKCKEYKEEKEEEKTHLEPQDSSLS